MSLTIAEALAAAGARLSSLDDPALEGQLLLAELLGRDRSYLFAYPEARLSDSQQRRFDDWLQRRADGEPMAYLSGRREFWSLDLRVTPDTLIPRPETETLVEQCLARIPADAGWRVADLGTGSGAIALALASERSGCRVVATDRSEAALLVAAENAKRLGLRNLEFGLGDWFEALGSGLFELIVSNPPYIPERDPHLQQGDVRREPRGALASGDDGLVAIRHLVERARSRLIRGGWLLFEHGYDQRDKVLDLLAGSGYDSITNYPDLAGLPRVAAARNPQAGLGVA